MGSRKTKLKKILISSIILILIFLFIGHKIMNEMQETNEIQLNFKSDESLKGLRVNLVVYKNDMPSTSYGYKKQLQSLIKEKCWLTLRKDIS